MNEIFKKGLIRFFDPIAIRLGYKNNGIQRLEQHHKNNLLHNFYILLKSMEFEPAHIIDVGANHGTWTREALIEFPNCRFTLLEPQSRMKDSIKDLLDINPKISFYAVGAGKESGSFKFTIVDRDDSCSFNYSEKEAKEKGYEQIEIPVVTLNEFVEAEDLPIPDIIKIDAEGLDLEVLQGASNFFGKTEVFMVEAGVAIKEFKNSFLALMNFMDNKGYRLLDITDMNRPFTSKVLWLVELVFVKKGGIIDSHKWI